MHTSNKPTRGTPVSQEERLAHKETPPKWWGGPRFYKVKKYGDGASNSKPVGWKKTRYRGGSARNKKQGRYDK